MVASADMSKVRAPSAAINGPPTAPPGGAARASSDPRTASSGARAVGGLASWKTRIDSEVHRPQITAPTQNAARATHTRQGVRGCDQVGGQALEHDPAAVMAGAGAEVDDPVGLGNDGLRGFDVMPSPSRMKRARSGWVVGS